MTWIPSPGARELSDLSDVDTSGVSDDQVLRYDADTGMWLPGDAGSGGGGSNASYAETIGDNSNTSFQVTHDLGTQDLVVQLWDLTGAKPVEATGDASQIKIDDDDNLTVTFSAPPSTDSYRVVVLASGGESSGGGNGTNLAFGKPYTLSPAPSGSFPDTPPGSFLLAGDSDYADSVGRLTDGFVPPPGGAGTGGIPAKVSVGWQTANDIVIRLDLKSAEEGATARIWGFWGDSGLFRPNEYTLEYSDNDADWTEVESHTGLNIGSDINTFRQWMIESDISAAGSHRYWRWTLNRGPSGDWIFVGEVEIIR